MVHSIFIREFKDLKGLAITIAAALFAASLLLSPSYGIGTQRFLCGVVSIAAVFIAAFQMRKPFSSSDHLYRILPVKATLVYVKRAATGLAVIALIYFFAFIVLTRQYYSMYDFISHVGVICFSYFFTRMLGSMISNTTMLCLGGSVLVLSVFYGVLQLSSPVLWVLSLLIWTVLINYHQEKEIIPV